LNKVKRNVDSSYNGDNFNLNKDEGQFQHSEGHPVESITSLLELVSRDNIERWINTLSSFHTRHTKSPLINQAAYWLKNELLSLGYSNVYFHDYVESDYQLKNVICRKQGITPKVIIICAHYDSIMEDANNAEERSPGANDNASGVSVLLELARILFLFQLNHSIQFVFFSGEEQGLWGSRKYSEYIKDSTISISRLINLDMVGHPPPLNPKRVIIERDIGNKVSSNESDSQALGQIMKEIATKYTDLEVNFGDIYDSDYMPFEALGYTVVGVYDGGEESPTYHSKNDLPSSLNIGYIASVAKMVLATVVSQ
jgi:Zn-dependent M28 family amino/carboxypeptidase